MSQHAVQQKGKNQYQAMLYVLGLAANKTNPLQREAGQQKIRYFLRICMEITVNAS